MGSNPVNLGVRFLMELGGLAAVGAWGWQQGDGLWRLVWAIGLPLVVAVVWSVFAVPHDPSRSGKAPIPIPGLLRLILELVIFAFATWSLYTVGVTTLSAIFGTLTIIHYLLSYDRIGWLIKQ